MRSGLRPVRPFRGPPALVAAAPVRNGRCFRMTKRSPPDNILVSTKHADDRRPPRSRDAPPRSARFGAWWARRAAAATIHAAMPTSPSGRLLHGGALAEPAGRVALKAATLLQGAARAFDHGTSSSGFGRTRSATYAAGDSTIPRGPTTRHRRVSMTHVLTHMLDRTVLISRGTVTGVPFLH